MWRDGTLGRFPKRCFIYALTQTHEYYGRVAFACRYPRVNTIETLASETIEKTSGNRRSLKRWSLYSVFEPMGLPLLILHSLAESKGNRFFP